MFGFIYLLQTRESYRLNEDVFKIGKTIKTSLERFNQYPKGSRLILHIECFDVDNTEKYLIDQFNKLFTNVSDYGVEYFRGNLCDMKKVIYSNIEICVTLDKSLDDYRNKLNYCDKVIQKNRSLENEILRMKSEIENYKERLSYCDKVIEKNKSFENEILIMKNNIENLNSKIKNYRSFENEILDMTSQVEKLNNKIENHTILNTTNKIETKLCKECNIQMYLHNFNKHKKICKGVPIDTCEFCKKVFSSKSSKCNHRAICKLNPKNNKNILIEDSSLTNDNLNISTDNSVTTTTTTNSNNSNSHNTVNNNITNNNNIHIHLSVNEFGKEDLSFLTETIIQKTKQYGKKGVYGLADIIEEIHCNLSAPQNNNIIKPNDYGDDVYIWGNKNKWEYRTFDDIRDMLMGSLSQYMKKYIETKNELGVELTKRKCDSIS